ncbi:MAG: nickel pincer cofactor biosynthesis protein LarC [Gemmatimonadota bacterium]|nr:nickel pincer cofactor biosynthesis protein LarC [Gemmatimonadota bacterium]
MRIAILDPAAGISGDMLLGALIDAGAPRTWLEGLPARLGFPDVRMRVRKVQRTSLAATKVDVELPDGAIARDEHHAPDAAHGRHVGELMELVRRAPLSAAVQERALRAFELIGVAEARVHGTTPERVHLHEVGAMDAVLDIVGGIEGFERLGVGAVYNLPVATGTGWVTTAHGRLPVPAPATAVLLEGVAVVSGGPVEGEATTPTGAALLRVLSQGRPPSAWRMVGSGWGAGERDPAAYPNALRLLLAEAAGEAGVVEVLATDLDDLSPEYVEPLRAAVLAAGAVDCLAWPVYGKKGRVATRVEVLVAAERADHVVETLFRHSPTAGVRRATTTRVTLPRREEIVELQAGVQVRVKVWQGPDGPRLKAEYDDVLTAADRLGVPAWQLAREVERRASGEVIEGRTNNQRNEERA